MNANHGIPGLVRDLDSAIITGDTERADQLTGILFSLQRGTDADAGMPREFPQKILENHSGGNQMKSKSMKRIIGVAAAAALFLALGITAFAANLFGVRDLVFNRSEAPAASAPSGTAAAEKEQDLIVLQGYPDSNEYKASEEWNAFRTNYDTDGSIISEVGNSPNEFTERYPMYLVYSREMADKLEEIIAKYGLVPHESMTVYNTAMELYEEAGTGNFMNSANASMGGYVYNDGTFHFDGNALLESGKTIPYQFGRYVKGTFSDTYLNVGDADDYDEWQYATNCGQEVSLALGGSKALVIADLENSFVTINVLTGTAGNETFGSEGITADDLEAFADLFDYTQIG